jgi:hypothetical protein
LVAYFSSINSLTQYQVESNFDNSDGVETTGSVEDTLAKTMREVKLTQEDKKTKKDIVKRIGFDPFESYFYKDYDLKMLYQDLKQYVDDDDLIEDSYKLNVVIQIINGNHQIRILDMYLSAYNNNPTTYIENLSTINNIGNQRKNLLASITNLAKENKWLSSESTSSKNKLSGMMKKYKEYGFTEIEVNYFDMRTSEAVKTIMDLSNKSAMYVLNFSDGEQREIYQIQLELIDTKDKDIMKLTEERRSAIEETVALRRKLSELGVTDV